MDRFERWLREAGLGAHLEAMRANHVDLDVVPSLTRDDLQELGLPVGDRRRFMDAALRLARAPPPETQGRPTDLPSGAGGREGERRQLTIMFCDLVGSTRLSSKLPLEDYREVLRAYQLVVARIIAAHDGRVSRYVGDGVLAYFGYPQAHEDDPAHSVDAALDIGRAVENVLLPPGSQRLLPDVTRLWTRIGIATGTVVVGDIIGDGESEEEAVVGVTPNLAARLQGEAPPGGIIIAPVTHTLVKSQYDFSFEDKRRLKGIDGEVPIIRVLGRREVTRFVARTGGHVLQMVGREAELELLERRWAEALGGSGGATLIIGEAGIGKSRLLEQLIDNIAVKRSLIRCSCSPQHRNTPLYPVVQAFQRSAGITDSDDAASRRHKLRDMLGQSVPRSLDRVELFYALLSIAKPDAEPVGENFTEAILAALVEHLVWLAARQPVLLAFEDLHWADPTTRALIAQVAQAAVARSVLMVVTTRPESTPALALTPEMSVLNLTRMTQSESAELVQLALEQGQVADHLQVDEPLRTAIIRRADGVPLFLEQLAVTVADDGGQAAEIPSTLRDLLTARLDRLSGGKRIAQAAAVIGRQFRSELLGAVLTMGDEDLNAELADLERARIVLPVSSEGSSTYQFRHALMRDAAYGSLLRDRRRGLHARVAAALEARTDGLVEREPETVAYHHEEAAQYGQAVLHWESAGRRSRQRSANREAAEQFAHAIELLEHEAEPRRSELELRLRVELGGQLIACYGNGAAPVESNYERAQALVPRVQDQRLAFRAQHGLRTFYMVRGPLEKARSLGRTLLGLATRMNDDNLLLQAHRPHGLTLFAMGDLEGARSHLERAIALYRPELHAVQRFEYISDPLVLARCNLGWTHAFLGNSEAALDQTQRAVQLAETLEHRHSLAFALSLAASTRQALGDSEAAATLAERALLLAQANRYPYWEAWNAMLLGWAAIGAPAGSRQAIRDGLQQYAATGARMMLPYFLTLLAERELEAGEHVAALTVLDEAMAQLDVTGTRFYEAELVRLRGLALAAAGAPPEQVREALLRAVDSAELMGNALLGARARTSVAAELGPRALSGPAVHDGGAA